MTEKELYNPFFSFALSSSAGSGKTFALTTRLISILLAGIKPSEILTVTFTNLAANEIGDRLFNRIEKLELGDKKELTLFSEILNYDNKTLMEKAQRIKGELIRGFSLLEIKTIHSFFSKVIGCFPGETGLLFDFEIIDENIKAQLLKEAFEAFYETLSRDNTLLERVYNFIVSYRESSLSTQNILSSIYQEVDSNRYILEEKLNRIMEVSEGVSRQFRDMADNLTSEETLKKVQSIVSIMDAYGEKYGKNRNLGAFKEGLLNFLRYRNIKNLYKLTPFVREEEEGFISYLDKFYNYLPDIEKHHFKSNFLGIRQAIQLYLQVEMEYYITTWLLIYEVIHHFYTDLKERRSAIDFNDIELKAYHFLSGISDFDYLNYRIDSRIRYILIDEFQDTSEIQWRALESIVKNCLLNGGNIFYVGDIKQSIYRWRGGEPYLFEKVRGELSIPIRRLIYNYRQNPTLIDFVNNLFKRIREMHLPEFQYEEQGVSPEKRDIERGFIYIKQFQEREELLNGIIPVLLRLRDEGINFNDMAILCRKNSELEEIENILLNSNIPYRSSGRSKLLEDFSIRDVENILDLVLNPRIEIYQAGLLRSPIFRYSYDRLNQARDEGGRISLVKIKENDPSLYDRIEGLISESSYLTPSGFIRSVLEKFSLLDLYSHKREYLLEFYELAYDFEDQSDKLTLMDFSQFIKENREHMPLKAMDEQGVVLQTIHSAKGLEYHTVILPFLSQLFDFRLDNSLIFKKEGHGGVKRYGIAGSSYRDYLSDISGISDILVETERNYRIDELNILYVALTRAAENLLILPLSGKRGKTLGDLLVQSIELTNRDKDQSCEREIGKPVSSPSLLKTREIKYECMGKKDFIPSSLAITKNEEAPFEDVRQRRVGILKGLIFHRAIKIMDQFPLDEEELQDVILRAASFEDSPYTSDEREKVVEGARVSLLNALADPRLEKYFSNKGIGELNFFSLKYPSTLGRLDRVYINEEVEIIDFKTDEITDKVKLEEMVQIYKEQINNYCLSFERIYPQKPIKGYLYFTDARFEDRLVLVFERKKP